MTKAIIAEWNKLWTPQSGHMYTHTRVTANILPVADTEGSFGLDKPTVYFQITVQNHQL